MSHSSPSSVTLKLYFTLPSDKVEIRRFTTSSESILASLLQFLDSTYSKFYQPPLRFLIQYDDGEDLLTVSSESELREGLALQAAQHGAGSVMKLMCRFDEAENASNLSSPVNGMSGMSTPSVNAILLAQANNEFDSPPSPSCKFSTNACNLQGDQYEEENETDAVAAIEGEMAKEDDDTTATEEVAAPTSEKTTLLGSSVSPRSDEDASIDGDLIEVGSNHGSTSDDEYVRIEEDNTNTPAPTTSSTAAAAAAAPTPVPTVVKTEPSVAPSPLVEVDAFASLIEERAPERFACRLCPKLFKGRMFVVEHIRNKHKEAINTKQTSTKDTDVKQTQTSSVATVPTSTSVEFSTQTASTVQGTSSTQTEECVNGITTDMSDVSISSNRTPLVDESSPKASPVEISDVTGHHAHTHSGQLDASPEPSVIQEPAITPTSTASTPEAIHRGISCDGCGMTPIIGNRYHCTACVNPGGFDYCDSCERSNNTHPVDHVFLKMRRPANVPIGTAQRHLYGVRRPSACGMSGHPAPRPRAQFIGDVTLADGLHVHAGETLMKVWSIKNTGEQPWPIGTRLVFAGGDLAPESDSVTDPFGACVPYAGPNDIVHVSLSIVVPDEPGRFRATFRLEAPDRTRFGPRIWIDLVVPKEEPKAEQPVSSSASSSIAVLPEKRVVSASAPPVGSVSIPEESKQAEEANAVAAAEMAAQVDTKPALPVRPSFQYANQLATLRSMGFKDAELSRYLLLNNQGDLQKVVQWLLSNSH